MQIRKQEPVTQPTTQHHLYPFNAADGTLAGIVSPMATPFDGLGEWQAFLDTLISGLVAGNPRENLDGVYEVAFHTASQDQTSEPHLLITRVSHGHIADTVRQIAETDELDNVLGLIAVIAEPDRGLRTATLALRGGYLPATKKMRKDRILATLVNDDGTLSDLSLDNHAKVSMRLLGKLMNTALDESLSRQLTSRPAHD